MTGNLHGQLSIQNTLPLTPLAQPSWTSDSLSFLFEKAKRESRIISPLTPREVGSLIDHGEFDAAVRGLGFILREGQLHILWSKAYPDQKFHISEILDRVAYDPTRVRLSPAQAIVTRMMHAVVCDGLHTSWHPSSRALRLIKPFTERLENKSRADWQHDAQLNYRVLGAASLLAAEGAIRESVQPGGIAVLKASQQGNIPAVLFTAHHAFGGDAAPLVTEYAKRKEILNGEIWCPEYEHHSPDADTVWGFQKDHNNWTQCFNRLKDKGAPASGIILVAEPQGDDPDSRACITQGFYESNLADGCTLEIVTDAARAMRALHNKKVVGLVSDLFIPFRCEETAKSFGDRITKDILDPWIPCSITESLLSQARAIERNTQETLRSLLEKLLALP